MTKNLDPHPYYSECTGMRYHREQDACCGSFKPSKPYSQNRDDYPLGRSMDNPILAVARFNLHKGHAEGVIWMRERIAMYEVNPPPVGDNTGAWIVMRRYLDVFE